MKIKEVIEQTGLTDRAIRLYIENGLISPQYDESFSGRKNIDFSSEDVRQLQNIALLRKAGFSIADIKLIALGGDDARGTIQRFIGETSVHIAQRTEILKILQVLTDEEVVTMDSICERLSDADWEGTVPNEDMKPPLQERIGTWVIRVIGVVGMIISLFFITVNFLYYYHEFQFPKLYVDVAELKLLPLRIFFVVQFVMCLILLLIRIDSRSIGNSRKRKRRKITAAVLSIVWIASIFAVPIVEAFSLLMPPVYSETSDPAHYMDLSVANNQIFRDRLYTVFPREIPDEAKEETAWISKEKFLETTKYYYRYANQFRGELDVFAQWTLPEKEYNRAKEQILIEKSDSIRKVVAKGDWECIYLIDPADDGMPIYNEEGGLNLIFAYNDEEKTVRYIGFYSLHFQEGVYEPYYLSLEW